ncbi:MAG TPA: DUF1109 domain-containing protein [Gallionella sp.]|nr:DUF1109 domain-containing protein [Gallionella sp.]
MMGNIEELINKLAQDTATVRPAPHPFMLSLKLMGWAMAYLVVALLFSGLRPDLAVKLHEPLFAAELAALAGIFITTSLSASLLSFPDIHQLRRLAFAPAIAFALFVFVMFLAWQADNPPAPLPVHSFQCTLAITLVSLLPAAWMFYMMRKFASTHYHLAGCCALLFAFSIGAIWLRLYEVNNSIMHVIEWHYLPMIAFGLAGLWLGKNVLKW